MEKLCRNCGRTLALSEFYKHPQMPDGHLNQCKDCKKAYANQYRQDNLERVKAYDRERGRTPEKLARNRARQHIYCERSSAYVRTYRQANPEKSAAHRKVGAAIRKGLLVRQPCEACGATERIHAHHDDYSKPLDVVWLCHNHHMERHRLMRIPF